MTHHLVGAAEVAKMLGVTRQRVAQIAESDSSFPSPEVELASGRIWSREAVEAWMFQARLTGLARRPRAHDKGWFEQFTEPAWRTVVLAAQDEARLLSHDFIRPEHLLLALARTPQWPDLVSHTVRYEDLRHEIARLVPPGRRVASGFLGPGPTAREVVELAIEEAKLLGEDRASMEHLILAVLKHERGTTHEAIRRLGLAPEVLVATVLDVIEARKTKLHVPGHDPGPTATNLESRVEDLVRRLDRLEARLDALSR